MCGISSLLKHFTMVDVRATGQSLLRHTTFLFFGTRMIVVFLKQVGT